jgi:hypothetical protein
VLARFVEAAAMLKQLPDELQSALATGGAGVDWWHVLARVEAANATLLQVVRLVEDRP